MKFKSSKFHKTCNTLETQSVITSDPQNRAKAIVRAIYLRYSVIVALTGLPIGYSVIVAQQVSL